MLTILQSTKSHPEQIQIIAIDHDHHESPTSASSCSQTMIISHVTRASRSMTSVAHIKLPVLPLTREISRKAAISDYLLLRSLVRRFGTHASHCVGAGFRQPYLSPPCCVLWGRSGGTVVAAQADSHCGIINHHVSSPLF